MIKKRFRGCSLSAVSLFVSNCVQNSPNCVAKLRRDLLAALANHVSVNCLRNRRTVGVPESLLTQFLRCPETGGCLISFANTNRLRPMLRRCAAPRGKVVCEAGCSNQSWRIRAQTEAPHQVSTCIKRGIFQRSIGALAGLQGLHPRDSLALGDKGHEYRINGPRSRPQGPHVWPHLRSLLCLTQVGSRTCGDGLNSARFIGQRTWSEYARPASNGNRAAPLQEFAMLPANTLSTMSK